MTRKSPANSVIGLIGAEGSLRTAMVDSRPAGANVRLGNPLPKGFYLSVAAIRRISSGVRSPASGVPGIRYRPMASPPISTGS